MADVLRYGAMRSGCGLVAELGFGRGDIHPHHLPDMPIRILEAAAVHEAVVLARRRIDHPARRTRLLDRSVNVVSALGRDAEQHLAGLVRIRDPLRSELAE